MTKSNLAANLRRYMKLSETTNTIEKLAEKSTVQNQLYQIFLMKGAKHPF